MKYPLSTPFWECTKYKHWLSIFSGNTSVQLQTFSIEVFENVEKGDGLLCVIIGTTNNDTDCLVGFQIEVIVSLNSSTEGRNLMVFSHLIVFVTQCVFS